MPIANRYLKEAKQRQLLEHALQTIKSNIKKDPNGKASYSLSRSTIAVTGAFSAAISAFDPSSFHLSKASVQSAIFDWISGEDLSVDEFLRLIEHRQTVSSNFTRYWFLTAVHAPSTLTFKARRRPDRNTYISIGEHAAKSFRIDKSHKGTKAFMQSNARFVLQGYTTAENDFSAANNADQIVCATLGLLNLNTIGGSYSLTGASINPSYSFYNPETILLFTEKKEQIDVFAETALFPRNPGPSCTQASIRRLENMDFFDRALRHVDRPNLMKCFYCYQQSITSPSFEEAIMHLWRTVELVTKCGFNERDKIRNRLLVEIQEPNRSALELIFWTLVEARDKYLHEGTHIAVDLELFDQMRLLVERYITLAINYNTVSLGSLGELIDTLHARRTWNKKLKQMSKFFKVKSF